MDYYEELGVNPDSDPSTIKKAYRGLCMKWHPDKNNSPEAKEKFQQINSAYSILSNKTSREKYQKMTTIEKSKFINFLNSIFL